jgi:hypothetical protein
MVTVGRPAEVQGLWNNGSPVVLRSLGAGVGVEGMSKASNLPARAFISRERLRRILWA